MVINRATSRSSKGYAVRDQYPTPAIGRRRAPQRYWAGGPNGPPNPGDPLDATSAEGTQTAAINLEPWLPSTKGPPSCDGRYRHGAGRQTDIRMAWSMRWLLPYAPIELVSARMSFKAAIVLAVRSKSAQQVYHYPERNAVKFDTTTQRAAAGNAGTDRLVNSRPATRGSCSCLRASTSPSIASAASVTISDLERQQRHYVQRGPADYVRIGATRSPLRL